MPPSTLAVVLHCLADAPRLPSVNWESICHCLFTPTTADDTSSFSSAAVNAAQLSTAATQAASGGNSADVNTAVLMLALKHGRMTSHGFGSFLDDTFSEANFPQLPLRLQHMLLTGLPEVLQSLSTQRSTALLSTLCSLPPISNSPQHPDSFSAALSTALWTGLARCLHSAQHAEQQSVTWPAAVVQAAHAAVRELLPQLLPPPLLLPAEQLPEPKLELDSALGVNIASLGSHTCQTTQQVAAVTWGAACRCLQLMPQSKVSLS